MGGNKPLVVVLEDEVVRHKHRVYWEDGKTGRPGLYKLETPLGEVREIKGRMLEEPRLNEHSDEYLYLELTNWCNFHCSHCGVGDDMKFIDELTDSVPYLTHEFASALNEAISKPTTRILPRRIFFGGGEPLINHSDFSQITNLIRPANSEKVLFTNGYYLPLKAEAFFDMVRPLVIDMIAFSSSYSHAGQYARLAGEQPLFVPNTRPERALIEKAAIINEYCQDLDLGFWVNEIVDKNHTDLRAHILRSAGVKVNEIEKDATRGMCSQGQELAIRYNGDLYSHCYDIFQKKNKVGVVGLLLEEVK